MPTTANLLSAKLARANTALKAGRLEGYASAKVADATDGGTQHSWGPAMRR